MDRNYRTYPFIRLNAHIIFDEKTVKRCYDTYLSARIEIIGTEVVASNSKDHRKSIEYLLVKINKAVASDKVHLSYRDNYYH